MRTEDPPATDDACANALQGLRERLRALSADSDVAAPERAERLGAFESDLLAFSAQCAADDPTFRNERGLPALAWAADWRNQIVELGLADEGAAADGLVERIVADEAQAWTEGAEAAAATGEANDCFEALVDASLLDREAVARRRDASLPPPLRERRDDLRTAFLAAIEREQPGERLRKRWAMHLADASDVVLTAVDDLDAQRTAAHLSLMADDVAWHLDHVVTTGTARRRLRRKLRRLRNEMQERELQGRLEQRFGRRFVFHWDRLIVWLIFAVLGALAYEIVFGLSPGLTDALLLGDTGACVIFLTDFFVRLGMVRGKGRWFLRHFLIDLLPSIPFVLVLHAGRALRLVRVARLTRGARALGFLSRGFDRLARRYGYLLNHNIVLYPNRAERALVQREQESLSSRVWRLRSRTNDEWRDLLQAAPGEQRATVAATRVSGLEAARTEGLCRRPPRSGGVAAVGVRDIPAEEMLRRLDDVSPAQLEADLGPDFVSRAARAVRMFARAPLRWLPVIRRYVPRVAPHMSEAEVAAAAAHKIAGELGRHHGRWFWAADLYGTVTPSEFVDRVGTTMVRSSFRPAYRLALFGIAFLIVDQLNQVVPSAMLDNLWSFLKPLVGDALIILGGVCLLILGIGWWLKRIAGQATFFYEQTVNAQFLALTESIKARELPRDAALFDQRVFAPEDLVLSEDEGADPEVRRQAFCEAMQAWLVQSHAREELEGVSAAMERAVLLYRDSLDGALFTDSDNRTTSQLLGSPALRQMRGLSGRVDRREAAALHALDLSRPRSAVRGPYLWFSFIAKAISQATARLVVEYNRYAIPLAELPFSSEQERLRYESWVATGKPPEGDTAREKLQVQRSGYITTAFTALHFLDDEPGRDREVEDRFGTEVLENLKRDRRMLFREAFGTYPLHTRSKDQRVLNLYRLYERWFGGGRAFLIPLRIIWRWVKMIARLLVWLGRAVAEIRTPRMRGDALVAAEADFATAARKIGRMRDPIVWASLWLRARFDAEYMGVRLPGATETGLESATWERDLTFLDAPGHQRRRLEREQTRAEADVRRLARLVDDGLLDDVAEAIGVEPSALSREHVRAATVAYRGDFRRVRSLLSCHRILEETAAGAFDRPPLGWTLWPRPRLKAAFRRWWKLHGREDKQARTYMWRAVVRDVNGARWAMAAWGRFGPEHARARGVERLAELLRHPGRISEQIVTLRIVQTLALIDLLNYREHVYRLGGYEDSGDEPGELLRLADGQAIDRPPSTASVNPLT